MSLREKSGPTNVQKQFGAIAPPCLPFTQIHRKHGKQLQSTKVGNKLQKFDALADHAKRLVQSKDKIISYDNQL